MSDNDIHPNYPLFTRKQVNENPILRTFNPNLPPHLLVVAHPFAELAARVVNTLPSNAERTKSLNKLREAKDCAVTCVVIALQLAEEAKANATNQN